METNPGAFKNPHSIGNRVGRLAWSAVYRVLFRPSPWFMGGWRSFLLKVFGAKVKYARVAATARVWAPWLLEMGEHVYIDANVDLYNPFGIIIGDRAIVSRGSFLCTASHDYRGRQYKLTGGPIVVENDTWIAADCFIAPGVTVRRGAVVGARAVVTRDVDEWKLVAGNPATVVKDRTLD